MTTTSRKVLVEQEQQNKFMLAAAKQYEAIGLDGYFINQMENENLSSNKSCTASIITSHTQPSLVSDELYKTSSTCPWCSSVLGPGRNSVKIRGSVTKRRRRKDQERFIKKLNAKMAASENNATEVIQSADQNDGGSQITIQPVNRSQACIEMLCRNCNNKITLPFSKNKMKESRIELSANCEYTRTPIKNYMISSTPKPSPMSSFSKESTSSLMFGNLKKKKSSLVVASTPVGKNLEMFSTPMLSRLLTEKDNLSTSPILSKSAKKRVRKQASKLESYMNVSTQSGTSSKQKRNSSAISLSSKEAEPSFLSFLSL